MNSFLEFCRGCAKVLLLICNGLCILLALCTFGFGVADIRVLKQYGDEHAIGCFTGDLIIIFSCLLLIAIAGFGCAGAVRESVKILYLYVGFLMILVVLELIVGIYVGLQRYGLEIRVVDWLRNDFFGNTTATEIGKPIQSWDSLQETFECCGLNGPEDYPATQREISVSCCAHAYRARTALAQKQLYQSCIETHAYYAGGCEDEIVEILRADSDYLFGMAITSVLFEAGCMLLATLMANNLKNSVQVYKHTVKY